MEWFIWKLVEFFFIQFDELHK